VARLVPRAAGAAPCGTLDLQALRGVTRLNHLGRPRAPLDAFDLVVTTPQYSLPGHERPAQRPSTTACSRDKTSGRPRRWLPRMTSLPRPWIVLLVGGNNSSSDLSVSVARDLRAQAQALARERGGSLFIATSPRTPAAAADVLLADSDVPGAGYRWGSKDLENPYPVFLQQADS
jgi:mitochondrial fission protein ELM1